MKLSTTCSAGVAIFAALFFCGSSQAQLPPVRILPVGDSITFGSGGESMTALLGGHVDAISSPVSSVMGQLRAGKIRIVAVSAPRRLPGELAEVPTWSELGVRSSIDVWRALAGPKGMSAAQIAFWEGVAARAVKDRSRAAT